MHRRVQVEVAWFIALSRLPALPSSSRSPRGARKYLLGLVTQFLRGRRGRDQGDREDHQPRREGGRVLDQVEVRGAARAAGRRRVRALRLHQRGHQQHQPCAADQGGAREGDAAGARRPDRHAARDGARASPQVPMLARTHGQTASPTTVGKEIANVAVRLAKAREQIAGVAAAGQDERRGGQLQRAPGGLARLRLGGLQPQGGRDAGAAGPGPDLPALQHPDRAARLHGRAVRRGGARQHHPDRLRRATSGATSAWATSSSACKKGEIGSSTMPHKVNPIDFENAEGNLGLANALLRHLSREAADQPLAARPDRQHGAAQHRRGPRLRDAGLRQPGAPAWASSSSTRKRWPPTSTPRGKCWPSRSRP